MQQNNTPQDQNQGMMDPFHHMMFGPPQGYHQVEITQNPVQQPAAPQNFDFMKFISDDKGNFDINKVMGHADQVFKIIDKTGPMLKQLQPLLKIFQK